MSEAEFVVVGEIDRLKIYLQARLACRSFEIVEFADQIKLSSYEHRRDLELLVIVSGRANLQDGLDLVRAVRAQGSSAVIVLLTRYSSEARVMAAFKAGVNDYFKWPWDYPDLLASIKHNLAIVRRDSPNKEGGCSHDVSLDQSIIGKSPAIQQIKAYLPKVAATDSTVLISGDTGTGKERVAHEIHQLSPRRSRSLVCINCAALPDGLLESELFGFARGAFTGAHASYEGKLKLAGGGSVFFDEIGDLSLSAQAKVLRVFENKEITPLGGKKSMSVDIRVMAATNRDLPQLVSDRQFREDLYYRLTVARIHLPPLRERKEDIGLLLGHYVDIFSARFRTGIEGFTERAFECLLRYGWPGNIRELRNLVEALLIEHTGSRITLMDLPEPFHQVMHPDALKELPERELLLAALLSTNWNKTRVAQKLNWSRMTVYRKMLKYNLPPTQPTNHT